MKNRRQNMPVKNLWSHLLINLHIYIIFSANNSMLPLVSGINFRLLSVNHALNSPFLTHPVLFVALLPSVPSTHHSHYPLPLHSFIPGLKLPFLEIFPTIAYLFFIRTDSTHRTVYLILLSMSVYLFFYFFPFPLF